MSDPNFWSIISVALALAVTLIGALLALLAYGHHRRQAIRFWEREQRLPDATRLANLQVQIEELREEYDTLKDNVFDAQQTIEAAENQRQWMEDAKEEIARLEEDKLEVARIQNELETAQSQLASLNEQKSGLDGEIADRKSQLEELDERQRTLALDLQDLQRELERAAALREEITQLEDRKKAAQEQAEQLEEAAAQLRRKLEVQIEQQKRAAREEADRFEQAAAQARRKLEDELEQQKRAAKEEVDSLDRELNDLKRRREESEAAASKLQESLDRLKNERTDLEKERRKLASEVAQLESKSNALSAQIPTLETMFDNLSSAVAQHDGPTKPEENEIWQPVLPVLESTLQKSRSEQECLEDLAGSLVSFGLKFDRRTLYAFHTSLKTTDSSPLVTLAGVSGTGKSELPRRYAEATGINFLNVAVQPRWDSPQDLFGFYDYLERRFRPTDLTRALIQMDPIGAENDRGWNPPQGYEQQRLPNQLLLVLLDEMNLARIEYYFSEFLSRLETRRSIDPKNSQRRKLAEIPLDVGGRRSGQPPMQLFVDKNVLFVGTMNEDETTQALSDKVIDRANVLRFGSPNSIVPVPASQRNGRLSGSRPRLTRDTWEGWCKTSEALTEVERGTLLDWIGELRGSMDQVNRPFAYRVAHSMLEYAANYPDVERHLDFVIADQIEQKILPKLMGLNPQDPSVQRAFGTIDRILEKVDDDALKTKIEICRKDDYFQWTGIDRTEV
ncbi:AAA family ATPase [Stieleria sp. JC731]|uniref:AAA family ATPase n=1 Tax=Pirellulaceae TaxID=2691357 RepID=UPI001E513E1E|nr:AAA family ATPase [Stieleria sp. JC731]MCC9601022.1 AAA family ATPase [Stieleria sp. JC731]